jgi:hypothetical protein
LGWPLAITSTLLAAAGAQYSGILMNRLRKKVPNARVYADIGRAAYGTFGMRLVAAVGYTYMYLVVCGFQLTAAKSLENIFYNHSSSFCSWYFGVVVAGVMMVIGQTRSMNEVSSLAILGESHAPSHAPIYRRHVLLLFVFLLCLLSCTSTHAHTLSGYLRGHLHPCADAHYMRTPCGRWQEA